MIQSLCNELRTERNCSDEKSLCHTRDSVTFLLIGVLLNGLTMLNLPYYAFDIVKGLVLILALAVTYLHVCRKKRA